MTPNSSSSAHDSTNDSPPIARAILSPTRPWYWSVRRELWENRSLYIAPLSTAGRDAGGRSILLMDMSAECSLPSEARDLGRPRSLVAWLLGMTVLLRRSAI